MKSTIALMLMTASSFTTSNDQAMKSIQQRLNEEVAESKTPSVQYFFFDTDSVLFEFSTGKSNLVTEASVDARTRYHLFSVTKTFTAVAVLQLAETGKIDLGKAAVEYLPDFPYDKSITVRQLLSHTAGIPNPLPLRWIHLENEHASFHRDEFFSEIFQKHPKLEFAPGTGFKYSNLGYVLLGQLVERISGLSFDEYVRRNIVEQSGVTRDDLGFTLDTARHAVGYQRWFTLLNAVLGFMIDKKKFMGERTGDWVPFKPFHNNGIAYGGLFGTGNSLVRYGQALICKDSKLLSDASKSTLFTECTVNGKGTGMAMSWFTGQVKGHSYVAHAGGGGGYYIELRLYPNLGVGSALLYNRTGVSDERALDKLDVSFLPGASR